MLHSQINQMVCGRLPVFRGKSALSRGPLKSKGGGKTSIFHNAELTTAELLLRIIVSFNQLSLYGAVQIGGRNLPSNSKLILQVALGHPLRTWRMSQRLTSHQRTYRTSPDQQFGILEPEYRCGNMKRNSKPFGRSSID